MIQKIIVPPLGESVSEATVARWLKAPGEQVRLDEPLVELETDKITLEVNASDAGTLAVIHAPQGASVKVGALLGEIASALTVEEKKAAHGLLAKEMPDALSLSDNPAATFDAQAPEAHELPSLAPSSQLSPAVLKMITEHQLNPAAIQGSGKDNRLLKEDVLVYLESRSLPGVQQEANVTQKIDPSTSERVPLTRLRLKIAQRLKEAQNTAAMLTTFNEIDMTEVMALRTRYKDIFEKKHNVKLGFMSFFTKACVVALKEFPTVNAEIDGDEVVYKYHYDIGVAVSAPQGLVVPVIRHADSLSFAEIEKAIGTLGSKAREGKLSLEELSGGTFTITNGGIFGSLMSTPILNPPQSGILGMHKIQERPVAVNGAIVIRPMMYVALTYDHRLIDGREAVTFLVRVKECIENPECLLLDI